MRYKCDQCGAWYTVNRRHQKAQSITACGSFRELKKDQYFYDVSLDQQIEAHMIMMVSSSPFLTNILKSNKYSHPLIYMSEVRINNLTSNVDFIYIGLGLELAYSLTLMVELGCWRVEHNCLFQHKINITVQKTLLNIFKGFYRNIMN